MSENEDHPSHPIARPGVMDISAYIPGKSSVAAHVAANVPIYKLSSNESALGASPFAIDAFKTASENLHLYPDGASTALRKKIGNLHNLPIDEIICGAGSDEILQLLCRAYLQDGDNIVQTEHGFLVYEIAARACGADVRFAPETNLRADVDAILEMVDDRTRLVFIANPNNPTGTWIDREALTRLRNGLRGDIILVIDAAYAEYLNHPDYEDGSDLVARSRNVVMTRTFSKIYGLGGLRLGWAYGPKGVIDALNRIRGPFNISAAAQITGMAALDDQDFINRNRTHNDGERAIMLQRLNGLGLDCPASAGNFLLVKFPSRPGESAADIQSWLASQGVIVRDMTAYRLPEYLRISIGSSQANARLLDLLSEKFEHSSS